MLDKIYKLILLGLFLRINYLFFCQIIFYKWVQLNILSAKLKNQLRVSDTANPASIL